MARGSATDTPVPELVEGPWFVAPVPTPRSLSSAKGGSSPEQNDQRLDMLSDRIGRLIRLHRDEYDHLGGECGTDPGAVAG